MTSISKPTTPARAVVALLTLVAAACSDAVPTGPQGDPADLAPQWLLNGEDDFDHRAAGSLMVYDPAFPDKPGWRTFCSGALVHRRVFQTAGHCIQFLRAQLEAGTVQAAWISFQQNPDSHFNDDPAVVDPATGGWHEIESLHDNPDNVDFLALMQSPPEEVLAVWGKFHDSGAIVLKETVTGIRPMKLANRFRGQVEKLLDRARCEAGDADCPLIAVAYGLPEFPPTTLPPVLVRRSAPILYAGIDPLFIGETETTPGSGFGASCPGDSGAPIILRKRNGKDLAIVAIGSSPADPFGFPCANGALHYRVDTESHIRFINDVIRSLRGRRPELRGGDG